MGYLGAHVSVSGGIENSIPRGLELGCEAIQIFSKNQKQWKAPPISDRSAEAFQEALRQSKIQKTAIHDSYLINLASPDPSSIQKSREAFLDELIRADRLGVPCLVFHPGSHMKTNETDGLRRIADSMNWALENQIHGKVVLLLETTAGQGNHLGYRFEQLAEIICAIKNPDRVGVCYDTAHAFAAGYDIRTEKGYEETFSLFDRIIGLEQLKAFHMNDSKSGLGSRVDRHEHIGEGLLGLDAFRFLVNDPRFKTHPMILETPGKEEMYKINLERLRSLLKHQDPKAGS